MTLRQIVDVLWKRVWIIVAIVAIALGTAVAYLQLRTVDYESGGTVRLNAVVTEAALAGEYGGIAIELDADALMSPAVLDPAAEALGESSDELAEWIDATLDSSERLGRMDVSAYALTPGQAQERASAVIASYREYVDTEMATLLTSLTKAQQTAIADATKLQQEVEKDPSDAIASTNLAVALSKMTSLTSAIEDLNNAGAPTVVTTKPWYGEMTVPSALIVLLVAMATGLVVGIAAALIREQFDNRLRGEDDAAEFTGARVLGELGWDRHVAAMHPPLPVAGNERTDLSERLRTLRSTLQVFLPPHESAFVVTSVEPGDGKSFVSANLAMAWSRAGKRVILVGGDLRRPDLARYFGEAADGEGLSAILQEHEVGESLPLEAVQSRLNATRYRRLMLLPAGAEPPDPADLLARPVVAEVIAHLRSLADVVVIDSPPAIGMADAALLATHSDGAIVVAAARRTDRARLVDATGSLRAAGVEVIGLVVNRSRRRLPKTYSSYYVTQDRQAWPTQKTSPSLGAPPPEGLLPVPSTRSARSDEFNADDDDPDLDVNDLLFSHVDDESAAGRRSSE